MVGTTVSCPQCGKRLHLPPGSEGRRARCPGCGGPVALGPPARPSAPESASEWEPESTPRPTSLWWAVVLLALLGFGALPLALVSEVGIAISQKHPLPSLGWLGIGLMAPIGIGLLVAAVGLLLRRAWGRVVGLFALLFGATYYAKLLLPVLLRLRWEHPDAPRIALSVFLLRGVPLLGFLLALVLLFQPGLRTALARPRARRRR